MLWVGGLSHFGFLGQKTFLCKIFKKIIKTVFWFIQHTSNVLCKCYLHKPQITELEFSPVRFCVCVSNMGNFGPQNAQFDKNVVK